MKHSLLLFIICLLSGAGHMTLGEESGSRPDILLVLVDDLGFSDFGCYGSEIETPHIDRLAAGGLRFAQFLSENKCNPSRTSLMTGQYYHRGYDSGNTINIAEGLGEAGYRSGVFGKWDVMDDASGGPLQRGFDF